LDDSDHDVLIDRAQEVLHLLPQELQFAQLAEFNRGDPSEFGSIEFLPNECEAVVDSFEFEEEEEERVVLVDALLADHAIQRVLRPVLQSHVVADIRDSEKEIGV